LNELTQANLDAVTGRAEGREQNHTHQPKDDLNGWALPTRYTLAGSPYWCFSGVPQTEKMHVIFPRLMTIAVHGLVTTFIPSEGSTDGLIRVVVMFDQLLLQRLCGLPGHETIGAGISFMN